MLLIPLYRPSECMVVGYVKRERYGARVQMGRNGSRPVFTATNGRGRERSPSPSLIHAQILKGQTPKGSLILEKNEAQI